MEGNGNRMGKTLGIDMDTAREIRKMSTKELGGYLTRVTAKSYGSGYEEGLADGVAMAGQALGTVLKKYVEDGTLLQVRADEVTKSVDEHIAGMPGRKIKVGMTVYGLMNSADGYFEAEGTVTEADDKGFQVIYKILPSGKRYRYENIGKLVYIK